MSEFIDEIVESEGFIVNDDNTAEWCIKKISAEKQEMKRQLQVIDYMIQEYQLKKNKVQDIFDKKIEYFNSLLMPYFESVEKKSTKTQETYKLPSGILKRKFGTIEYIKDDTKLLKFLKANNPEFVKVTESPMWGDFKKTIQVKNGSVVTQDGEIIECIKVETKPATFKVEVE